MGYHYTHMHAYTCTCTSRQEHIQVQLWAYSIRICNMQHAMAITSSKYRLIAVLLCQTCWHFQCTDIPCVQIQSAHTHTHTHIYTRVHTYICIHRSNTQSQSTGHQQHCPESRGVIQKGGNCLTIKAKGRLNPVPALQTHLHNHRYNLLLAWHCVFQSGSN